MKPSIPSNTPLPLQKSADELTACIPDNAIIPRSCNLESSIYSSVSNPFASTSLTFSSTLSAREPLAITPVTHLDITSSGPPFADDPQMLHVLGNVEVYSPDEEGTVEIQSGFWDSAIADIFLPPQLDKRKSDPKPRSSSHRL